MAHVLVKNFSANGFGQVVNTINNLGLVPLYLHTWGVSLYGEWLVLIALPAYFMATADAGFVPVSGNDMTIKYAEGRRDDVVKIFQSSWLFTTVLSLVIVICLCTALATLGISRTLGLTEMTPGQATRVLFYFILIFLVNFQQGMLQVALRAVGRYAEGTVAYNVVGFVEALATAAALLLGGSPTTIAALLLCTRVVAALVSLVMIRRYAPWLTYGYAQARLAEVRRLLVPSVAILGIPAGNAALLQGVILILNHTLGPAGVAVFATTRTMTRVLIQLIGLISFASWPEISRHYGAGRKDLLAAFLTHGTQFAGILGGAFAIVGILAAPLVFAVWTGGRIEPDRMLVAIMMLASVAATFRAFPATILQATNRHVCFSGWYFVISLIATAICYPFSEIFGVIGAAVSVAIAEIAILGLSFAAALSLIEQGIAPLRRVLTTRPPVERLFGRSREIPTSG